MKARTYILDFVNYILFLLLSVFFFYYLILGDKVGVVSKVMRALVPLSYFALAFVIKMRVNLSNYKKRKKENDTELVLYLSHWDKIKDEIVIFLLPVIVLLVASLESGVDATSVVQALLVFIVMYAWHIILFRKIR